MRTLLVRLEKDLKRKRKELTKFFTLSFALSLILTLLFYFPPVRIVGSLDNSLSYRFFIRIKASDDPREKDKQIRKYRYVEAYVGDLLQYPPIREKRVLYLVKKVACFPGDKLEVRGDKFYCNGNFIARAHPESPFPPISESGVIPEGHYFLLGTHPRSFDSRYMGVFPIRRITAVLIPLF